MYQAKLNTLHSQEATDDCWGGKQARGRWALWLTPEAGRPTLPDGCFLLLTGDGWTKQRVGGVHGPPCMMRRV